MTRPMTQSLREEARFCKCCNGTLIDLKTGFRENEEEKVSLDRERTEMMCVECRAPHVFTRTFRGGLVTGEILTYRPFYKPRVGDKVFVSTGVSPAKLQKIGLAGEVRSVAKDVSFVELVLADGQRERWHPHELQRMSPRMDRPSRRSFERTRG